MIHKHVIEVWTTPGAVDLDDFVEGIRAFLDTEGVQGTAFWKDGGLFGSVASAQLDGGLDDETAELLRARGA